MARASLRRSPTPGGLEAMERGTLRPFDLEAYANVGTGVLEEYLDERARRESFRGTSRGAALAAAAIVLGAAAAVLNLYVGLKVGFLLAAAWYAAFLVAIARRRGAPATSTLAGAALAGSLAGAGLALVLPALHLLARPLGADPARVPAALLPAAGALVVLAVAAGALGVLVVAYARRLLVVEEPLPFPGAEAHLRLLDMSHVAGAAAARRAGHGLRLGAAGAAVGVAFGVLRDAPLVAGGSVLSRLFGPFATGGTVGQPVATATWTWLGVAFSPLLLAVGWLVRARAALLVLAGAAFAWLVAVPLAVALDVPTVAPGFAGRLPLSAWTDLGEPAAILAHAGPVRLLGAGALLGAGLAFLVRSARALGRGAAVLAAAPGEARRRAHEPARGWYEWSPLLALAALVALVLALGVAGGPAVAAVGAAIVPLVFVGLVVLGVTGLEPVTGGAAIVVPVAFAVASVLGSGTGPALVAALVAGAAYATAASVAGAALLGAKTGLFAGARPATGTTASILAVVAGGLASAAVAALLLPGLPVVGEPVGANALAAPHAAAFDALGRALAGSTGVVPLLVVGLLLGVLVEAAVAGGLAFGLGLLLPFGFAATLALGAGARHLFETRILAPRVERLRLDDEKRAVATLDTYLLAAGLVAGEAAVAITLALL